MLPNSYLTYTPILTYAHQSLTEIDNGEDSSAAHQTCFFFSLAHSETRYPSTLVVRGDCETALSSLVSEMGADMVVLLPDSAH